MNDDYCKLVSGIILSTIWREDDHTRILWITMLALKGRDHRVLASVPGLAAVANIPIESCRAGLVKLATPDKDSRTKEYEGRRIMEVEGGWMVLNGEKYRNFLSKQERNEYQAKLMAERRAAKKLAPVSEKLAVLGHSEAEAEAEVRTRDTPLNVGLTPDDREVGKVEAPEAPEVQKIPDVPFAPGSPEVPKSGNPKPKCWSPESRAALAHLNEAAGRHFRETDVNLRLVQSRLDEVKGDLPGVRMMIDRAAKKWRGTEFAEYLRPETLFCKSKFGGYYDNRDIPVPKNENDKRVNPRNVGTCEVTTDFVAAAARRSPEYQRSLLERQVAQAANQNTSGIAGT
jgi:uncharacterized phage protein (TIGR02220 family)